MKSWGFPPYAIVLSLALHGLALAILAPRVAERALAVPPAALHGRLSPVSAPVAARPTVLPAPTFVPAAALDRSSRSVSTKAGSALGRSTVSPAPTFDAGSALAAPPAAPGGETAMQPLAAPATAALREESDALAPNQAGLRQYRLALAGEARRFRRHPEAAEGAGLSGTAEVRVTVDAGGANRRAELSRSSGHAALDGAALDMLRQAARHAALPASLRGRNFAVLLPVVFEAEE